MNNDISRLILSFCLVVFVVNYGVCQDIAIQKFSISLQNNDSLNVGSILKSELTAYIDPAKDLDCEKRKYLFSLISYEISSHIDMGYYDYALKNIQELKRAGSTFGGALSVGVAYSLEGYMFEKQQNFNKALMAYDSAGLAIYVTAASDYNCYSPKMLLFPRERKALISQSGQAKYSTIQALSTLAVAYYENNEYEKLLYTKITQGGLLNMTKEYHRAYESYAYADSVINADLNVSQYPEIEAILPNLYVQLAITASFLPQKQQSSIDSLFNLALWYGKKSNWKKYSKKFINEYQETLARNGVIAFQFIPLKIEDVSSAILPPPIAIAEPKKFIDYFISEIDNAFQNKDWGTAINLCLSNLSFIENKNFLEQEHVIRLALSNAYYRNGNMERAFTHNTLATELGDSINMRKYSSTIGKHKQEIEKEKRISDYIEKEHRKMKNYLLIVSISLALSFLVGRYIYQLNKKLRRSLNREKILTGKILTQNINLESANEQLNQLKGALKHSVKNDFGICSSSILNIVEETKDSGSSTLLIIVAAQLQAFKEIYSLLYTDEVSPSRNAHSFFSSLLGILSKGYSFELHSKKIDLKIYPDRHCHNLELPIRVIKYLGVFTHECITNFYKHGKYEELELMRITLKLEEKSDIYILRYTLLQKGANLSEDVVSALNTGLTPNTSQGLGILHKLAYYLEGDLKVDNKEGGRYKINIPINKSLGLVLLS